MADFIIRIRRTADDVCFIAFLCKPGTWNRRIGEGPSREGLEREARSLVPVGATVEVSC